MLCGEHERATGWAHAAEEIKADILEHGVDERGMLTQHYDTEALDASLLLAGSFMICSFWLVSALCEIGEFTRARRLCSKLLGLSGPLELYAEEIEATSGEGLGNFPQAFTHLALINAVQHVIRLEQQHHSESAHE